MITPQFIQHLLNVSHKHGTPNLEKLNAVELKKYNEYLYDTAQNSFSDNSFAKPEPKEVPTLAKVRERVLAKAAAAQQAEKFEEAVKAEPHIMDSLRQEVLGRDPNRE